MIRLVEHPGGLGTRQHDLRMPDRGASNDERLAVFRILSGASCQWVSLQLNGRAAG